MSDFLGPDHVFFDVEASSKEEALQLLAQAAEQLGVVDTAGAALDAYRLREEEGTTGLMDGFAIPHAKSAAISRCAVLVQRFAAPISDWGSLDGGDIDIAISLLIPDSEAGTTHLKLLSQVAVLIMGEDFRAAARAATSETELAELIANALPTE